MRTAKRFITACLTAIMTFQALAPSTQVFAQELDAAQDAMVAAAYTANDAAQGAKRAVENLADSTDKGSADTSDGADSSTSSDKDSDSADTSGTTGTGTGNTEEAQESTDDATADDSESADESATDEAASDDGAITEAQTESDYAYQTLGDLKKVFPEGNITGEGASLVIKVGNNEQLIWLSNTDPSVYQYATIEKGNGTGKGLSAAGTLSDGLSFRGFGSDSNPFEGTYSFDDVTITTNKSLFNNVKWSDKNSAVKVEWTGTDSNQPIVATKIDGNRQKLVASVTVDNALNNTDNQAVAAKLTSPLLGQVSGTMTVDATYATNNSLPLQIDLEGSADNIGLLANALADNTLLTVAKFDLPASYYGDTQMVKTTADGKSAGALIGDCGSSSTVTLGTSGDFSKLTVAGKEASGGFIGKAANFTLTFDKDQDGKDASVKPALKVGNANTTYAGGAIGDVSFAGNDSDAVTIEPDKFDFNNKTVELGARKRAGGLFGRLDLTNGDVTVKGGTYESKLKAGVDSDGNRGSYGGIAGNVCSTDASAIHALNVEKNENDKAKIEIERAANLCYVGGIAGYQGDDNAKQKTAIVLDGAQVQLNGAAYAYTGNGKLGGAVGVVDTDQLLDVRDFKLSSADNADKIGKQDGGSAGIAGSAWRGIIKFSGTTDLSNAQFADSDYAAQLVYQNYNALIFATGSGSDDGWTFKRPSSAVTIDDVYSYGEVIRLGDKGGLSQNLINVDPVSHVLTLGTSLKKSGDAYVLNSVVDFAKLAITWQTFGYRSMVDGISGGSVASLASSNIQVANEIDLSGTGLTGLSKDRSDPGNNEGKADGGNERESTHYFSGTLTGSGTIKLAVGEPYGERGGKAIGSDDTSDGNGKIYRHQRLGLFNAVTGDAKIENLTIDGAMHFDDKNNVDAGALAATFGGASLATTSAHFTTAITYDNTAGDKYLNVGGILGSITGSGAVSFSDSTEATGSVTSRVQDKSNPRVGGAVGFVAGDSSAKIKVDGLTIGGSIDVLDFGGQALAGGFIGYIAQGNILDKNGNLIQKGGTKTVDITGLSYKDFSLKTNAKNASKKYGGGLLGYSWGNAIVTIGGDTNNSDSTYALKTSNTSVTANNATEFGGLLYAMSGHFIINNYALDLSDAKLTANQAKLFGVLIARGGTSDTGHSFGVENAYTGLYLEDRAEWATAYKVPGNGKISATAMPGESGKDTGFDEWVAATTKIGSTTMNGECNGLISLHTADKGNSLYNDGKLYMGDDASKDNSYQNRTAVGQAHKTNQNARYYYNLDRCLDEASPKREYTGTDKLVRESKTDNRRYWVKSPGALMIWSACRNSPDAIRDYIAPGLNFNVSCWMQIGNTSDAPADKVTLDLDGYSYYPVDVSGAQTIYNVDIKFHYSDIKNEQAKAGNKSNAEYTQHANMHMALFRVAQGDFKVEKNVTLAGSVGRVVSGSDPGSGTGETNSGALICRSINGSAPTATRPATVVNVSFDQVVLNGLTVDGANEKNSDKYVYAPLLINNFLWYAKLDVQRLSVQENSYGENGKMKIAASSLFGKFGIVGAIGTARIDANQVSANFHNNVELPSSKKSGYGIFTRASFFDSFGYGESKTGSASYIFNTNDAVTYGEEIDSKGTEHGKQLWYYDAPDYGNVSATDGSLVGDGEKTADINKPQFVDKYLPYVYNRQVEETDSSKPKPGYREIKVNQRAANLETGCGTYSDPYVVKKAQELYALTNYIRGAGNAVDGWEVTVTTDQDQVCTRRSDGKTDCEATYQYSLSDGGKWKKVSDGSTGASELDNDTMHLYMQSAYYSIEPADKTTNTIEVDAATFGGFGSHDNPFRGVIVGKLGSDSDSGIATISIKNAKGSTFGLVPYSYGSVVRNLNVKYDGGADNVSYAGKYGNDATPQAMFGGVIGCIMGGDNIIDGVSVSSVGGFKVEGVNNSAGQKSYLVPVGGYVGAICGGGVIFRHMSGSSWHTNETSKLYDNPYVGRVIDGYAFSEGCNVDNGNDNYKVNELESAGTPCVTTGKLYPRDNNTEGKAVTTTVRNEQGLLVLSAIINSGAAAGPTRNTGAYYGSYSGSAAYKGGEVKSKEVYSFGNGSYGKVRNAKYDAVGNPKKAQAEDSDSKIAYKDDCQTPGAQSGCVSNAVTEQTEVNSPYLVSAYATKLTGYVCAPNVSGMDLQFAEKDTPYDMRSYGLGFLGLSGRYYSNACVSNEKSQDRDRIVPAVARINGHKQTILVNNQFSQYSDDDYTVRAVGGLFSAVMYTNMPTCLNVDESIVTDLYFGDKDKASSNGKSSTVSLTFKNDAGETTTAPNQDYCVGMLAGVTANRDSLSSSGKYSNIKLESCSVESPKIAGGLLGASGWASRQTNDDAKSMIDFDDGGTGSPAKLFNCSYDDVSVKGGSRVGGFVGALGSGSDSGIWVTEKDFVVGQNSTIEASASNCIVGGAFGITWSPIQVNVPSGSTDSQNYKTAKIRAVEIKNYYAVASEGDGATYRGTGGIIGNAQRGCQVANVLVEGENAVNPMTIGGTAEPVSDNNKFQSAGGVVGQINEPKDGTTNSFDDVTVRNALLKAKEGAGGLVGTVFNGSTVQCSNIDIDGVSLGDKSLVVVNTYSGGLVGTIKSSSAVLEAQNVKVEGCTFPGEACSAIAGDGKGTFKLSNVLVSKNKYQATNSQGLLLGKTWSAGKDKDLRGLYVAGLDIVPEDGKTTSDLPDYDAPAANNSGDLPAIRRAIHQVSYVALADYNNVSTDADKPGHYAGDGSDLYNDESGTVASASPYVTTNPVSGISIDGKSLFGDGVATYRDSDGKDKILAGKIKEKALAPTTASTGTYTYNNIGGCDKDGNYQNTEAAVSYKTTADSTFNENNPFGKQVTTDFPVLVIPGNDTKTVASYLDVITNGGYSDAVKLNDGKTEFVKASVKRIEWNSDANKLVEADGDPSLSVVNNGKSNMSFRASTGWDNNEGRFTLLTVTFNDGAGHKYKVQVPVIVKRMLEIDFTATYSEGSNFNKKDYANSFDKHVLVSGGETMTGYLTWAYNEALGKQTEYGWTTHLAGGGAMRPLNKTIEFKGSDGKGTLPNGTQLTLVDTADNNKEYHCTVGENGVKGTSVKLTDFYRGTGNNKTFYKEKWLSESFGVKADESKDGSGQWVKMTPKELEDKTEDQIKDIAGAKVGSDYYRVRTDSDDSKTTLYDLSVDNEGSPSENFYLVVRTPANTSTTAVRVNGYTDTSVLTTVNHHINKLLRKPDDKDNLTDSQQNTASTYGIASNYGHNLVDHKNVVTSYELPGTMYPMGMEVSDTISFGNQDYLEEDKLYYQLDSSLVNYSGSSITGAMGYPAGTGGTYSFYVKVGEKYYTYESGKWTDKGTVETAVSSGRWDADGGDMSLTLNGSDGKPLDLSWLRTEASAEKQFTIIMKADLTMSEAACINGIVASQNPSETYTKPSYRAAVSVHADTLKTSSNTAYSQGNASYYRKSNGASTIALEASDKSQLGINVNDLQSADGRIGLVGTYDIHDLISSSAMVSNAASVAYTLSLQRRNDSGGYDSVDDIDRYITVRKCTQLSKDAISLSSDKKSYVFSDTKKKGVFSTYIGSDQFNLSFEVKVNTNVEASQQTYANYRLVLTAHMTGGGVDDSPKNSDYVTYTLTKINTSGIGH